MLMTRPRMSINSVEQASVHNYYERLVTESILYSSTRAQQDPDFLADVSCVALNHLPPRYIRHDVDMSFFMSPVERQETSDKVQQAVDHAIEFVTQHQDEKTQSETNDKPETTLNNDDASETTQEAVHMTEQETAQETVHETAQDTGQEEKPHQDPQPQNNESQESKESPESHPSDNPIEASSVIPTSAITMNTPPNPPH